jgi:hypothetical protein
MPGSFRSAAAQAVTGQATLTHESRPENVPADQWLAPGEWIRYWSEMPYGLAGMIAEASTVAKIDTSEATDTSPMNREARRAARRRGQSDRPIKVIAEFKPARATLAAFALGIVGWALRDENDQPVEYVPFDLTDDRWIERVQSLRSALPTPVVDMLDDLIDSEAKAPLDMKAPDADHEEDTEGNASGGS